MKKLASIFCLNLFLVLTDCASLTRQSVKSPNSIQAALNPCRFQSLGIDKEIDMDDDFFVGRAVMTAVSLMGKPAG